MSMATLTGQVEGSLAILLIGISETTSLTTLCPILGVYVNSLYLYLLMISAQCLLPGLVVSGLPLDVHSS